MTLFRPRLRGTSGEALRALLAADRFRLGRDTARVANNLAAHGGAVDDRAPAWIGNDLPPLGTPSITLGAARGTLGPHSFGFLDNRGGHGVAPLAVPLPVRPRAGSIAVVCGRRDALPDVGPLCVARDLGVSWIVSVGDGEVDELFALLAEDTVTTAVMVSAPSLKPGSLAALGGKPAIVLGRDPLVRAAARRAGSVAVDDLEAWLAYGALLGAGVARPERPSAVVVGGGGALVEQALRGAGLALPVKPIDDDDPDALADELARASVGADLVLAFSATPLPRLIVPSVTVDPSQLERVRALAGAIVARRQPLPTPAVPVSAERARARQILDETGDDLADHDAKRMLKCYGARVSRQGPANSATAALRVGGLLGLPVDVVTPARGPAAPSTRRARTTAELRRAAAVLLDEGAPYVLVRQAFPDGPRARLAIRRERGVGVYALVTGTTDERALLPLDHEDAALLARAAGAAAPREAEELLLRIATCAAEWELSLECELFVGAEPAVIAAHAHRARKA